jgi:Ca2+-binding EF-hand superfamily protein
MKNPVIYTLRGALCALVAVCSISVSKADENKDTKNKPVPAKVLEKYDANKNGTLDESEKAAWEADKAKRKAEEMAKRLEKWDTNKDGKLDESEKAAEKAARDEMMAKKKAEKEAKQAQKDKEAAGK